MRNAPAREAPVSLSPAMFAGPRRLRPFMPMLRRLPAGLSTTALAFLSLVEGVVRVSRLRRALAWSAAWGAGGADRWRIAAGLLLNHGRMAAETALLHVDSIASLRDRLEVHGRGHLDAVQGGAIILGLHVGPPKTALALQASGFDVRLTGRMAFSANDARWEQAIAAGQAVPLGGETPRQRAHALQRLRQILASGASVYMTADGGGEPLFTLDVLGGPILIRRGWFALRRATRVPVIPAFARWNGPRRIIEIHPPLPDPIADATGDRDQCQAALSALAADYVRRYPAQCRYVLLEKRA